MFVNIKNMETKKEKLNEEEIRALIEGAYAQTTTLPDSIGESVPL